MPNIVKTEGIVLKGMDFLETSRIITFYSQKYGKIKLLAKGVRRPKSKFGSSLESLTRSSIVFYKREQKDLYTVSESDILDSFKNLKGDLMSFGNASILLDFLDKANSGEGMNPRLYRISVGTLKAMERCAEMGNVECGVRSSDPDPELDSGVTGRTPNPEFEMLLWGYLWRGLTFLGYKPELERCVVCKKGVDQPSSGGLTSVSSTSEIRDEVRRPSPLTQKGEGYFVIPENHQLSDSSTHHWSSTLGGILCRRCWGKDEKAKEISLETLNFLRSLRNGIEPITKLKTYNSNEDSKHLIQEYLTYHLDKRLLSFDFLNSLQTLTERKTNTAP